LLFFIRNNSLRQLTLVSVVIVVIWLCGSTAQADDTNSGNLQPAALYYTGTYRLRETNPELTGRGVRIAAVCRSMTYVDGEPQDDYMMNLQHQSLADGNVTFADGLEVGGGISGHSTAIGGLLIGDDPMGFDDAVGDFYYEGAAPDAEVEVYEFWRFLCNHVFGGRELDADILTMSVGTVFEDWWTRGIERMADKEGLIVFAGAGNGNSVFDPLLYPAAGANVIAVGVVDSAGEEDSMGGLREFSVPRVQHSSCGPTADDRCKPDIVAPGNCLVPDANSPSGYSITGNFSSFATPIAAGTAGLLVQHAHSVSELGAAVAKEGGNCVIKAILMNSATKLPYWHKGLGAKDDDHEVSLDYSQGAGAINAEGAFEQLAAGQSNGDEANPVGWDNNVIDRNGNAENVYPFEIAVGEGDFITATLVWNRHYGDSYPFEVVLEEDSDLRLELWAIDAANPQRKSLIDYSDSINDNVEHIYCPADPNYSSYEIVVTFSKASEGDGTERYGLAWKTGRADGGQNIWWDDINGDGEIDDTDRLVFAIFEGMGQLLSENSTLSEMLKLSPDRIALLTDYWQQYRPLLHRLHGPKQ
jgi:hypothetical protein